MKKDMKKVPSMGIKKYLEKTYEEAVHLNAERGSTPLHAAVQRGYLDIVKYLIKEGADVNAEDNNGYTPLFYAVDLKITKYLLEKGADLNARADNGATVLHIAAGNNNLKIVQFLVENGADMNAEDNEGYMPLHYAIQIPKKE